MGTFDPAPELRSLTKVEKGDVSKDDVIIEAADNRRYPMRTKVSLFLAANTLLILTCLGIALGFGLGFGVRELHPSKDALMWLGMPGELFLRMLKMMILPLIVCSVITGTASLDPRINGKISAVAFAFITATNVIACVIAVVLCLLIKPGEGGKSSDADAMEQEPMETQDIFADLLRNVVPDNMVEATFRKARTAYTVEDRQVALNDSSGNGTFLLDTVRMVHKHSGKADGINVLGLIVIGTIIGIAINQVGEKAQVFLEFFNGATEVVLAIIRWFFWLTPVGVASLIAVSIAGVADIADTFAQLGRFVLAVTLGLLLHQFLVLPLILFITTRRNPFLYLLNIVRPVMIGFASTSTAVAIPEMLDACESKNKIDKRVARFVIPFCVTLNADGSALYITSAAIFIAQFSGAVLGATDFLIIGVLTSVTAMAIPSVPSASIVTLVIILTSLGFPVKDIALLFAVEWFLDRLRTACNVISHTFCAAVTYHYCKTDLRKMDSALSTKDETIDTIATL